MKIAIDYLLVGAALLPSVALALTPATNLGPAWVYIGCYKYVLPSVSLNLYATDTRK